MTDTTNRAPFKSGVLDHEAVGKRYHEIIGDKRIGGENGVDVTPQPVPPAEPGHYDYGC